ncbi:MAG: Cna B-type domain-containing protein, partial [Clostridia bacterium]|nr:Cna B-type domain-containing protein [Clostridia bacterium]
TADDMPVNKAGKEISYSWSEDELSGYTLVSEEKDDTTTLTNTHEPQMTELTVKKVWDDDSDRDGLRPGSLTVTLMANEKAALTAELDAENSWTATVKVPVLDAGRPIKYEWTEPSIPDYTGTCEVSGSVTVFTNTHTAQTTDRTIRKLWYDNDDQDGKRPENLKVTLMADGEAVQTVTLSEKNDWSYTVKDLPVFKDGVLIEYKWAENGAAGYVRTNTTVNNKVTTLTNTHVPETIRLTVVKEWANDEESDRPASVVMMLKGGSVTYYVALNAANGWTETIAKLPRYAAGEEIEYTWTEVPVDGYTLVSTVTEELTTVFTNEKGQPPENGYAGMNAGECFE